VEARDAAEAAAEAEAAERRGLLQDASVERQRRLRAEGAVVDAAAGRAGAEADAEESAGRAERSLAGAAEAQALMAPALDSRDQVSARNAGHSYRRLPRTIT
jgi:hypothetical protein